jgi:hypothetical protein
MPLHRHARNSAESDYSSFGERVQKALQLFDLMEKFVERARNPVGGGPLVYDPGDDSLPMLVVPRQRIGRR